MEAYFNIVSMRTVREYSDRPLERDVLIRILEAGRASGSSRNTQPWRFWVAESQELRDRLAEGVYAPDNVRGCRVAVSIVTSKAGFDTGRCAQNMLLAAWALGVGSAPNGIRDQEVLKQALGLTEEESVGILLSLGYPTKPHRTSGDSDAVLSRITRRPLDELVVWRD